MIAARQELDLRPPLERLDRLILRSEGIDPGALTFAFRPLWQLDAPAQAALALSKAQATQIYAGLGLWPAAVTARLVEAQLVADGTYPNAAAVFAEAETQPAAAALTLDFDPAQPRGPDGRWTSGGGTQASRSAEPAAVSTESQGSPDPAGAPVPWSGEGATGQEGQGPQAPDGTPITPVAFKGRRRALARTLGVVAGAMGRLLRRWWPEGNEKADSSPGPSNPIQALPPALPGVEPPNLTMQDLESVTRGFTGSKSAQKWLNQMNNRGWTPEQIEDAITTGESFPADNRISPTHGATGYIHPGTGRYVVIDKATGKIIQLGGEGFQK